MSQQMPAELWNNVKLKNHKQEATPTFASFISIQSCWGGIRSAWSGLLFGQNYCACCPVPPTGRLHHSTRWTHKRNAAGSLAGLLNRIPSHWFNPFNREPSQKDRKKERAIEREGARERRREWWNHVEKQPFLGAERFHQLHHTENTKQSVAE